MNQVGQRGTPYIGVAGIAANSVAVGASLPVCESPPKVSGVAKAGQSRSQGRTGALVVLVVGKDLVGGGLSLGRELGEQPRSALHCRSHAGQAYVLVDLAGVPEERNRVLLDRLEVLGHLDERRVSDDGDLENVVEDEVGHVASTEAVAGSSKRGDSLSLECGDDLVQRRASNVAAVLSEPGAEVKVGAAELALGNGIAVQVCGRNVWTISEVFCSGRDPA